MSTREDKIEQLRAKCRCIKINSMQLDPNARFSPLAEDAEKDSIDTIFKIFNKKLAAHKAKQEAATEPNLIARKSLVHQLYADAFVHRSNKE